MRVIDRYVLRNFMISYLIIAFVLIGLYVLVDLTLNSDEFTEHDQAAGQVVDDIAGYYGHQVFVYFKELSGIITLVAAQVTLITMNRRNEMTALLASGISLYRIIWPVIVLGLGFNLLAVADQELILPRIADQLVRSHDEQARIEAFPIYSCSLRQGVSADDSCRVAAVWPLTGGNEGGQAELRLAPDSQESGEVNAVRQMRVDDLLAVHAGDSPDIRTFVKIKRINVWTNSGPADAATVTAADVPQSGHGALPPARGGRLSDIQPGDRIVPVNPPDYSIAYAAQFHPDPGRYRMDAVKIVKRHARTAELVAQINAMSAEWDEPRSAWQLRLPAVVFISPQQNAGDYLSVPPQRPDSMLVHAANAPREIVLRNSSQRWMQFMSTADLREYSESQDTGAVKLARSTMHIRFTQPAINMILLLLGVPFVLTRLGGNLLANMAKCVILSGTCFVCSFVAQQIAGDVQTWAIVAAWMPVVLFGPVAVLTLDAVKT